MIYVLMIPIIDRHILIEWIKIFAMAILAMAGMLLISSIFNNLQDLLSWETPTKTTIEFFIMSVTCFFPVIIPVSLLISLLFILGHLHKNQELTAMRATGIGIFRITRSLWIAGAILSIFMLFLNATAVPYASERSIAILENAELNYFKKTGALKNTDSRGDFLFFHNEKSNRTWMIMKFSPYSGLGQNINIYSSKNGKLKQGLIAQYGQYDEKTNTWNFSNGRELFYENGILIKQPAFDKKTISYFEEKPRLMALLEKDANDLSIPEIREILNEPSMQNSSKISEYSVRYNSILASPFCCLVVVGIAIPFAVSGVRINPMVGVSKSIGLFAIYFVLTNICNALGAKQLIPPVIAAWLPNIILMGYAIYLCKKVN